MNIYDDNKYNDFGFVLKKYIKIYLFIYYNEFFTNKYKYYGSRH